MLFCDEATTILYKMNNGCRLVFNSEQINQTQSEIGIYFFFYLMFISTSFPTYNVKTMNSIYNVIIRFGSTCTASDQSQDFSSFQ